MQTSPEFETRLIFEKYSFESQNYDLMCIYNVYINYLQILVVSLKAILDVGYPTVKEMQMPNTEEIIKRKFCWRNKSFHFLLPTERTRGREPLRKEGKNAQNRVPAPSEAGGNTHLALQAQRPRGTRYTANAVPGNAGKRQRPETPGLPGRPPQVASSLRVHTPRPGVRLGSGRRSSLETASRFRFLKTTQPLSPSTPAWIAPRMPPVWTGQVLQGEAVSVPSQGEAPGPRQPPDPRR